jgi:hypothetical protein
VVNADLLTFAGGPSGEFLTATSIDRRGFCWRNERLDRWFAGSRERGWRISPEA